MDMKRQANGSLPRLRTSAAEITPHEEDLPLLAIETQINTDTIVHFVDRTSNTHDPFDEMRVSSNTPNDTEGTPATPTTTYFIRKQA